VRHLRRHLDQALDAAERLRKLEELRARDELDRMLLRLREERDHPAEVAHLPRGHGVVRVRGQAGVEDLLDARAAVEPERDRHRVLAVLAHAYCERLDTPQHEPRVERARHGAERLLEEVEALGDRRVVRRGEAADRVGVAAEVLRRRVHDDVRAELERTLQVRRRKRVVDDEDRAGIVRRIGRGADVDDVEERVRRRLDPHHSRVVVEVLGQVREVLGGDVVEEVALRLVHLRRHPVDAAVDVGDQDDALARVDEMHERRRRAEAG
jgi:hypothetical protein